MKRIRHKDLLDIKILRGIFTKLIARLLFTCVVLLLFSCRNVASIFIECRFLRLINNTIHSIHSFPLVFFIFQTVTATELWINNCEINIFS